MQYELPTASTPAMRAVVATVIVGGALYYVKPITFFTADGKPRRARWAAVRPEQIHTAVLVPWWALAGAVGALVDLFV